MGSAHAELVILKAIQIDLEVDRSELHELAESCGQWDFVERSQRDWQHLIAKKKSHPVPQ